ncbi:MAG TPA: mechanosensitive ion channel domain-containing protein [Paracoccaceae bacterium]|nr:mechanosensitive ion channel domain-containing protein [Paracoccaceae bacterium]
MGGSQLIRTILLALCMLCWAPAGHAQLPSAAAGGSESASTEEPSQAWFRIDRLNPGLPAAPRDLDRETPMGAVESFIDAIGTARFERAAHLLDLSRVPVDAQAERGPQLAAKLGRLIRNDIWIDWDRLPDRPDAVIDGGIGTEPRAGEMRRSLVVGTLELDGHTVPLRLRRVKPEGADPVWVFAPQSVGNIDALYTEHAPGWIHARVPREWQEQGWFSLRRWELVALPVLLVAAGAGFIALRVIFGWLAAVMPWRPAAKALLGARTALALLAVTAPLYWAVMQLIAFSAPVTVIMAPVLIGAMVLAVAVAVMRGLDNMIEHFAYRLVGDPQSEYDQHQRQIYTTIYAVRRMLLLVALVIGLGVVLTQLDVFSAIGVSLLASAGVLTVVLGIAAQPILGNILSSLQIALSKPIRIGDAVEYEGRWAYVEAIFFTHVRLRTWDERRMIVPVQYFLSHPFENYSIVDKKMTRVFVLTLDPRANFQELREAYLEIARVDEDAMEQDLLKMMVVHQDQNGVQMRFYCTAKDAVTAWNMHCRLREKTLDWIRLNHPEWWPRQREVQESPDADPDADPGADRRFDDAAE